MCVSEGERERGDKEGERERRQREREGERRWRQRDEKVNQYLARVKRKREV